MNDPRYHLQGGSDPYIYEPPFSDDIWILREDSDATCKPLDDLTCEHISRQSECLVTVFDGPENKSFPPDHYDVITDSDVREAQTDLKLVMTNRPNTAQIRLYHRLPLQSQQTCCWQHRPDYESMVKIFQPLLVANVIVRRMLPHLPFVSDPDRIRAIAERNPRAAVTYLIDELCSKSNSEPGRWRQFIQALEICGYKYIVDTLRGQDPVDHTYQRAYLKIITPVLRELIYSAEVLPVLWAYDVISNEDREEISQLERNWGAIAAADKLLDLVPRRHKHWYSHLIHAVKTAGRTEAVDILAIPEILSFDDEDDIGCKKQTSTCNDKESNVGDVIEFGSPTYSAYISLADRTKTEKDTGVKEVPDNCEHLHCDNYSDTEIEELYLDIRTTGRNFYCSALSKKKSVESISRKRSARRQAGDWRMDLSLYEEPNDLLFTNARDMESAASIIENERSNRSDLYSFVPPCPVVVAQEEPEPNHDKARCINKAPKPTPRKQSAVDLSLTDKCYEYSYTDETLEKKTTGRLDMSSKTETACDKDATNSLPLDYSEPFRSLRNKEDEDIFTTVRQVIPDMQPGNNSQLTDTNSVLLSQPQGKVDRHLIQRRISDELLDLLGVCAMECKAEDFVLKSGTEIKSVSKDHLNPELRKDLENMRDLEQKLNNLVHDGNVLKKTLQLQEDVNEALKQKHELSSKLSLKEKEAKALEAAIAGVSNLPRKEQRSLLDNNLVSKDKNSLSFEAESLIESEVKGNLKDSDKDSAFYSEFTKL